MLHGHALRALRACALYGLLILALSGCETIEKWDRQSDDLLDDINDPGQPSSPAAREKPSRTIGDLPHKRPPMGKEKSTVECWASFGVAKRSIRKRYGIEQPPEHHWHHVVGQVNASHGKFSEHDLHCTDNLILLPKTVHEKITSHYRKPPDPPRPGFRTVRQWQGSLGFEEQWNYGIDVLKRFGVSIPERLQP